MNHIERIELFAGLHEPAHKTPLIVDVRSEAEYAHAHIPGALNLPLLRNEERHQVGIEYKQQGSEAAVKLGFKLVGPRFHTFIEQANEWRQPEQPVHIYCWRGGMRSSTMSWVLALAGIETHTLRGGYKRFRNWVLHELNKPRRLAVLSGQTGTGKTEVLRALKEAGAQALDLEALAQHKGSAFGALGQPPQPSIEQFENLLALQLAACDRSRITWVEDESRWIGSVKIPDTLFEMMKGAPVCEIIRPAHQRISRISQEYGAYEHQVLAERTATLAKRLGGDRLKVALAKLEEGDISGWISVLFEYYDKTYAYQLAQRSEQIFQRFDCSRQSAAQIAARILKMESEIIHPLTQL